MPACGLPGVQSTNWLEAVAHPEGFYPAIRIWLLKQAFYHNDHLVFREGTNATIFFLFFGFYFFLGKKDRKVDYSLVLSVKKLTEIKSTFSKNSEYDS